MSENIFNTPLWIAASAVVLAFCCLAHLGLNLVRRLVISRLKFSHEE